MENKRINNPLFSVKRLILINHLLSESYNPQKAITFNENFPDQILCSINKMKFLVRGIDFELTTDGNIKFLW